MRRSYSKSLYSIQFLSIYSRLFLSKFHLKQCTESSTSSTIKDEKSAAKFHYIKTVSGKVVEHSAFRVVSIYW